MGKGPGSGIPTAPRNIQTITNPDLYVVSINYDSLDRKTSVSYPDNTSEVFQYSQDFGQADPNHNILDLTASKDRLGHWTYRHYNGNRQMDSMTEAVDNQQLRETTYEWCLCGSLTSITDPNFHTTTFRRDLQNRVYQKVFPDGTTIDYRFEGQSALQSVGKTSRLASSTDALGRWTRYSYFDDDNLSEVSYTDAARNPLVPPTPTVHYTYELYHNRISTIMADGVGSIDYTYYPIEPISGLNAGKLHTVNGSVANETISYAYDELGRVLSRWINGVQESVVYDSIGRITTTENVLTSSQRPFIREYEGLTSRLSTLTYPNANQRTIYAYYDDTRDHRVESIQNVYLEATISQFEYDYDANGRITKWGKLLDATASSRWFEYDYVGQLLGARNALNPLNATNKLTYEYDAAGNRTYDRNYNPNGSGSNGLSNTYAVNELNQVLIRTEGGTGGGSEPEMFVYDAVGNLTGDGAGKTFEWDAANRLTAINYVSSGNRTEFAYDGLGRRVKITEYGPGVSAEIEPTTGNYTSFTAGKFTLPAGSYTITLQGLNPTGGDNTVLVDSVKLNNVLVSNGSFETPPVSNYQVAPTATDISWSFSGTAGLASNFGSYLSQNLTTDGSQVAFIRKNGSISQSFNLSAATYKLNFKAAQLSGNAGFQRLRVTFRSSSAATSVKTFVWCGNAICEERDGSGSIVTKRFFADGEQQIVDGTPISFYYTRDHLGSIREVTDSDGVLKARYDYDPYGNRVVLSGEMEDFDFGYTGHYYHAASGLNLTLYRAYDPKIGRWLSRDPIAELGGMNLYGYVANSPVDRIDQYGLDFESSIGNALGNLIDIVVVPIDFWYTYRDMRDLNWTNTDKYFHCLANCRASRVNMGLAISISWIREASDIVRHINQPIQQVQDSVDDMKANRRGWTCPPKTNCKSRCAKYRPQSLPAPY